MEEPQHEVSVLGHDLLHGSLTGQLFGVLVSFIFGLL